MVVKEIQQKVSFAKKILNKKIGLLEDTENKVFYKVCNFLIPLNLCRMIANIIYKFSFKGIKNYDYCYCLWASPTITARFKSDLLDEICDVEFEGHLLPVPKKWHEYLTATYGDYMTPPPPEKRNGGAHTIEIVDVNNDYKKYTQ